MHFIPTSLLKKLYISGSLQKESDGFSFAINNCLASADISGIIQISLDHQLIPLSQIRALVGPEQWTTADQISPTFPLPFPIGHSIRIYVREPIQKKEKYQLYFHFITVPFGAIQFQVEDALKHPENVS